jgi:hypothetical protein
VRLQRIPLNVDRTIGAVIPGTGFGFRVVDIVDPLGVRPVASFYEAADDRWLLRIGDKVATRISSFRLYHPPSANPNAALILQVFERCDESESGAVVDTSRPPDETGNRMTAFVQFAAGGANFISALYIQCPTIASGTPLKKIIVRKVRAAYDAVGNITSYQWGYGPEQGSGSAAGVGKMWLGGAAPQYAKGLALLQGNTQSGIGFPAGFITNPMGQMTIPSSGGMAEVDVDVTLVPRGPAGLSDAFVLSGTFINQNLVHNLMLDWEEFYG